MEIHLYIDGICRPNPGEMGIGIYFEDGTEISEAVGEGTNNEAEYIALQRALEEVCSRGMENAVIHTDSQLLANQINGEWKIKSATSRKYVPRIISMMRDMNVRLEWLPREQNRMADKLSKKALVRETFTVESTSQPGTFYTVERGKDYIRCNCPGFKFRGTCRHIKEIEIL